MDKRFRSTLILGLLLLVVQAPLVGGGEWRHWRGPDHDGRAPDTGVFGETFGLELAWKTSLGAGYSGIVVSGGRLVTMFSDGQTDWLAALDAETGREIWRYKIDKTYVGQDGAHDGPISTPLLSGNRVFGLSPRGKLFALDLTDGTEVWSTHLADDHGANKPHYGFATSPILMDGVVVVQLGGDKGAVAGFDPATGKRLWAVGTDEVQYQSPVIWKAKILLKPTHCVGNVFYLNAFGFPQEWHYLIVHW